MAHSDSLMPPRFSRRGDSYYAPCAIGLHICGIACAPGDDNEQPYTARNVPAASHDEALAMFSAARAEAECDKEASDFLCDLNLGTRPHDVECVDNFYTNRQLLPRLFAAVAAQTAALIADRT